MKNPIVAFNRWYDRLPESWRFPVLLALCIPGLVLVGQAGVAGLGAGLAYFVALMIQRRWWLISR